VTWRVGATVALCLLSAFLDGLSNVLQQHEAEQVDDTLSLRPSLFAALARRRRWLLGLAADAGGYTTYAAALALGAVSFVQPILTVNILVALLLGGLLYHRRLLRIDWLMALVMCGGIALFLYETNPTEGLASAPAGRWLVAGPICFGGFAFCIGSARATRGPFRAALFGIAAAIAFAVAAVLTKSFVEYLGDGILAWAPHWEPYAMAVCTIVGFLVVQSAYQTGSLAASVAGTGATQPVIGVVLGAWLLNEHIEVNSPLHAVLVLVSLVAALSGIVALARAEERVQGPPTSPEFGQVRPEVA
jgi:drug/metabolite transporter (DMT)-like permease